MDVPVALVFRSVTVSPYASDTDPDSLNYYNRITWALDNSDKRRAIAWKGREHVLEHHTYERRMSDLVAELRSRGMVES